MSSKKSKLSRSFPARVKGDGKSRSQPPFKRFADFLTLKRKKKKPDDGSSSLEKQAWFHGKINAEYAEMLLKKSGEFLVREDPAMPGAWFIAVRAKEVPLHLAINKLKSSKGTRFKYRIEDSDFVFDNVSELIRFYVNERRPVCIRPPAVITIAVSREAALLNEEDFRGRFATAGSARLSRTSKKLERKNSDPSLYTRIPSRLYEEIDNSPLDGRYAPKPVRPKTSISGTDSGIVIDDRMINCEDRSICTSPRSRSLDNVLDDSSNDSKDWVDEPSTYDSPRSLTSSPPPYKTPFTQQEKKRKNLDPSMLESDADYATPSSLPAEQEYQVPNMTYDVPRTSESEGSRVSSPDVNSTYMVPTSPSNISRDSDSSSGYMVPTSPARLPGNESKENHGYMTPTSPSQQRKQETKHNENNSSIYKTPTSPTRPPVTSNGGTNGYMIPTTPSRPGTKDYKNTVYKTPTSPTRPGTKDNNNGIYKTPTSHTRPVTKDNENTIYKTPSSPARQDTTHQENTAEVDSKPKQDRHNLYLTVINKLRDSLIEPFLRHDCVTLARHLTKGDLEVVWKDDHDKDDYDDGAKGLEKLVLPQGREKRCAILDRYQKLTYWAGALVIAAGEMAARAQMVSKLIELADVLSDKLGNLVSFMAIMDGLSLPQVSRLHHTWSCLHHQFSSSAVLIHSTLKPLVALLSSGAPSPFPGVCLPYMVPLARLLETTSESNIDELTQDDENHGIEVFLAHLTSGRTLIQQVDMFRQEANARLTIQDEDSILMGYVREDIDVSKVLGVSAADQISRTQKLTILLKWLSENVEPSATQAL